MEMSRPRYRTVNYSDDEETEQISQDVAEETNDLRQKYTAVIESDEEEVETEESPEAPSGSNPTGRSLKVGIVSQYSKARWENFPKKFSLHKNTFWNLYIK